MRGAAASVNLTVAVAMATLLAVGGIIAGPAIVDCSRDPGGFGACLRDRLDQTPSQPPALQIEDGWIDAAANEYQPPSTPPVELEASPAALTAAAPLVTSSVPAEVAIVPAAELAIASPAPEEDTASVALIGPEGTMRVAEASAERLPAPVSPEPLAPVPDLATPVAPPSSEPAPIELSAEPSAPPPSEETSSEPSSEPEPSSEEPSLVVEFNPAYPNVVVLPAPLTGDNSSFRSLQLN